MQRFKVGGIIERSFELDVLAANEDDAEIKAFAILEESAKALDEELQPMIYIEYIEPTDDEAEE